MNMYLFDCFEKNELSSNRKKMWANIIRLNFWDFCHCYFFFKAFIATGFNTVLTFDPTPAFNPAHRQCDYEKEPGKVRFYPILKVWSYSVTHI